MLLTRRQNPKTIEIRSNSVTLCCWIQWNVNFQEDSIELRVIGLVRPWKAAALDIFPELPDGLDTGLSQGGVLSDKLGHGLRQEGQEAVQYHNLSIAVSPGPDPDCGYG